MSEFKLTPLTSLTVEDLPLLHVHATKDELNRSCNLTGDVRMIAHDAEDYANVPTIYYERVAEVDTQKMDEASSSVEIREDLQIKDEKNNVIGGWVMHVLVADLALYNLEKTLG